MPPKFESHPYQRMWVERSRPSMLPNTFETLAKAPAQLDACERLMLYSLVRSISPEVAVEVGTFQGGSATIIHAALTAAGRGRLWCIDPKPQLKVDWNNLADRATLIKDYSPQAFATVAEQIPGPIEFAFIDGIHRYEPVVADTTAVLPLLARDAWLLYHDAFHLDVHRAIMHCAQNLPGLSNAGTVCRYFNNTQWPTTVMGGFHLLHFHDPDRAGWLPASYHHPASFQGAAQFSAADQQKVRHEIENLIERKKSPIGIYGLGPYFAGLADVIADYSEHFTHLFEDDPLFQGSERLGWTIHDPRDPETGVKAVLVTMAPDRQPEHIDSLRQRDLEVVEVASLIGERPVGDVTGDGPNDPLDQLAPKLDYELFEGTRRMVFYGAGQFMRRLGKWIARLQTNFLFLGIVDDNPKLIGKRLWGVPIVALEDVPKLKLKSEVVVIASPAHEQTMWAKRQVVEKMGMRMLPISDLK